MRNRVISSILSMVLLFAYIPNVYAEDTSAEDMVIVRDDDFEIYETGIISNGSTNYPLDGDFKGMGVSDADGTQWINSLSAEGKGGFAFELGKNLQGNMVTVKGADGNDTKALQILRPENIAVTAAKLKLNPKAVYRTSKMVYSVDIKNGGKCGDDEGDAGYTKEVNNFFESISLFNFVLNFNDGSLIFLPNEKSVPMAAQTIKNFVAPENGKWFNLKVEIDALESMISVYVNDKLIGDKFYGRAFRQFGEEYTTISLVSSKDGENAMYFDNFKILRSGTSADELDRVYNDNAFSNVGGEVFLYPGSSTVFDDSVSYFSEDMSITAIDVNGDTYVPVRYFATYYGYETIWNADDDSVDLIGEKRIKLKIDDDNFTVDGEIYTGKPIYLMDSVTYASMANIAEFFDKTLYVHSSGLNILFAEGTNLDSIAEKESYIEEIVRLYPIAALGFEIDNYWFTMENLVEASGHKEEQLDVNYGAGGRNNNNTSYEIERYGIKRSDKHVKSGTHSGLWENHHFYPTIMTSEVPHDWTPYNAISLWIYSEVATGERITLGAMSNAKGKFDYEAYEIGEFTTNILYHQFVIDFTGWKKITIPFSEMKESTNDVVGFSKIDGLYFYTRAYDYEPFPETVLYLDDIKLERLSESELENAVKDSQEFYANETEKLYGEKDYIVDVPEIYKEVSLLDYAKILECKKDIEANTSTSANSQKILDGILSKYNITNDNYAYADLVVTKTTNLGTDMYSFYKTPINHEFSEVTSQPPSGSPVMTQAYFKEARALYGYNPKYFAGTISEWNGDKYMQCFSRIIEVVDENGKWYCLDYSAQIEKYAKEVLNYQTCSLRDSRAYEDSKLRFDNDGDAYMTVVLQGMNAEGVTKRNTLLMHSRDKMKTWDFYKLPAFCGKMEQEATFNKECLDRPPVIILHDSWENDLSNGRFVLPEKQADGTLVIPEPVVFCEEPVICCGQHSGRTNMCATGGGKVFFTYSPLYPGVINDDQKEWAYSQMPAGHSMEKLLNSDPATYGGIGVPQFIIAYDLETKTLSEPVFIGFAGRQYYDNHNWSTLALDEEGCINVFIMGHHFPLLYTKTKKPYDITEWEDLVAIGTNHSYASIDIDKEGTIYATTRNSERGYCFDISLIKKEKGGEWQTSNILQFWKGNYMVWGNETYLDEETGALYVSYIGKTNFLNLYTDHWAARDFIWPENSQFLAQVGNPPRGVAYPGTNSAYAFGGCKVRGDYTHVVTYDKGRTWKLATTEDFMRKDSN